MARPCVTPIMIARALMSRLTPDERAAFAAELAGKLSIPAAAADRADLPPTVPADAGQ